MPSFPVWFRLRRVRVRDWGELSTNAVNRFTTASQTRFQVLVSVHTSASLLFMLPTPRSGTRQAPQAAGPTRVLSRRRPQKAGLDALRTSGSSGRLEWWIRGRAWVAHHRSGCAGACSSPIHARASGCARGGGPAGRFGQALRPCAPLVPAAGTEGQQDGQLRAADTCAHGIAGEDAEGTITGLESVSRAEAVV